MYQASKKAKDILSSSLLVHNVEINLKLKNGKSYVLTDKDIIPSSLNINNKCVNGSNIEFGSVYIGEMNVSILKDLDRYALNNAEVTVFDCVGDEKIPMGVFDVSTPSKSKKVVSLKCYDRMSRLDVNVEEQIVGTSTELFDVIASKCDVEIVPSTSLLNNDKMFCIDPNYCKTYRDALSFICSVMGGFATAGRTGKIEIRTFQTSPCDNVPASRRTSSTISDFETSFCGVTARFLAEQNFVTYKNIDSEATGLILDLGEIPVVSGLPEVKSNILKNITEFLKLLNYTPCQFNTVTNPLIELGDFLTLQNVNGTNDSINCLVTSYSWKYHGDSQFKSVGDDAMTGIQTKADREMSNIGMSTDSKTIIVYSATNSKTVVVDSSEKTVVDVKCASTSECDAMMFTTIPFSVDVDGNVRLSYYFNNEKIKDDDLTQYVEAGEHFVTLFNHFTFEQNSRNHIKIVMKTEFVESENRMQNANIISIQDYIKNKLDTLPDSVIDETVPTVTIQPMSVKCSVFSQGLAPLQSDWDGTLEFTEVIPPIDIITSTVTVNKFTDSVATAMQVPKSSSITEIFNKIDIDIPDISISGVDTLTYLTDKTGVILTDKVGNKLTERGKNG